MSLLEQIRQILEPVAKEFGQLPVYTQEDHKATLPANRIAIGVEDIEPVHENISDLHRYHMLVSINIREDSPVFPKRSEIFNAIRNELNTIGAKIPNAKEAILQNAEPGIDQETRSYQAIFNLQVVYLSPS